VSSANQKTMLSTRSLSKHYDGVTAVNKVDFDLPEGQLRAVIGPNGAGKSTFVGLLCGRIAASNGQVSFDGQDVTPLLAHERISLGMAYTFQITSIFSKLSLYENVALAARNRLGKASSSTTTRINKQQQINQRVQQSLERVGLASRAKQTASDLAYGHQRQLEIAMGLAQEPRLFILDEPTQGLAESEIEAFKNLMMSMKGETTILLIEHNMDVVMQTAEHITVMDMGAILAEGTPAQVSANASVQAAYLGSDVAQEPATGTGKGTNTGSGEASNGARD